MDTNAKERGENVNFTSINIDVLYETPQQTSMYLSMYIVYCCEHPNLLIVYLNNASLYCKDNLLSGLLDCNVGRVLFVLLIPTTHRL